jgi:hypothetical protein
VDPRAGIDDVKKRKFLTPPGLELRPTDRPACSPSLYRLSYPAREGQIGNMHKIVFESMTRRDILEDLSIDGRIILKLISNK